MFMNRTTHIEKRDLPGIGPKIIGLAQSVCANGSKCKYIRLIFGNNLTITVQFRHMSQRNCNIFPFKKNISTDKQVEFFFVSFSCSDIHDVSKFNEYEILNMIWKMYEEFENF